MEPTEFSRFTGVGVLTVTLADRLKPLARRIRGIPGAFGIRPHRVYLVTESWSGARSGNGTVTRVEVELTEGGGHPPKIRQLNDERRALADLPQGSVEVGPITVAHNGTGVTSDQLRGVDLSSEKQLLKLRIVGPTGDAWYRVADLRLDRAIHWMVVAHPVSKIAVNIEDEEP